jgi:hypothetical protein
LRIVVSNKFQGRVGQIDQHVDENQDYQAKVNYAGLTALGASMPTSTIQLDIAFSYSLAAASAVKRSLERTHGRDFAEAFIKEHQDTMARAVRTSLCGRDEGEVQRDIALLKRSYRT